MSRKSRSDAPAASRFRQAIQEALSGREFATFEELQDVVRDQKLRHEALLDDDLQGLSPQQMHNLLETPFDAPDVIRFADNPASVSRTPVLRLFLLLAEALQAGKLKVTAKGNLPGKFVQNAAQQYWSSAEYERRRRISRFSTEEDFDDLHTVRLVAQLAGLIRKYKGYFQLTRRGTELLEPEQHGQLYMDLLRAWCQRFNWAYRDLYPELPIVQQAFAFTLLLLQQSGPVTLRLSDYSRAFLRAFPQATGQVEDSLFEQSREDVVKRCYEVRSMQRFAEPFGLVRLTPVAGGNRDPAADQHVRVLPLAGEIVQFPGLTRKRGRGRGKRRRG